MWVFDVIKFLGDVLEWARSNVWYVLIAIILLFSPVLRKIYNGIKHGILSIFSYEGIISIIISAIFFIILFSKLGLLKW